jgi:hypothetical protein
MNGVLNALRLLAVLALAAVALPTSAAPEKIFSISVTPAVLPAGQSTQIEATFRNESPNGNSTVNSLILTLNTPVNVTLSNALPDNGTAVINGKSVRVSNMSGLRPGKAFKLRVTVTVPSGTSCTSAQWLGQAFTGNSFGGDAFGPASPGANIAATLIGCDGILACKGQGTSTFSDGTNATGERGTHNKDGSGCVPVPYDFTNNIAASNNVIMRWDTTLQPAAALTYTLTWEPEFVDETTGLPPPTQVAWELDASGQPLPGKIVTGRACLSSTLPAPYGTLNADNGTTLNVTAGTVPAVPFPIMIGGERIHVTGIAGPIWTVQRAQGGTQQQSHAAGVSVMSTPLPIDNEPTSPYYQQQMQMCIWDEGWVAVGSGACPSDSTKLCAIIRKTTSVFDISDGWVSSR